MNCKKALAHKDDFLDGSLSRIDMLALEEHLLNCPQCKNAFENDRLLLKALRELPVPSPKPGFTEGVLQHAISRGKQQHVRRMGLSLGGVLAACLALWIFGVTPSFHLFPSSGSWDEVVVSLNEPKTIKVLVDAPQDYKNTSVTIQLSDDLEVVGFPGLKEISWDTDIKKGKNYLSLPVVAYKKGKAELIATLQHTEKTKILKVEMTVQPDQLNSKNGRNWHAV